MWRRSASADDAPAATPAGPSWERVGFEAFGVQVVVNVDAPELVEAVHAVLPPGWKLCEPRDDLPYFTLARRDGVSFRVEHEDRMLSGSSDLDVAIAVLESEIRAYVSLYAPDRIFIHAGVVGLGGRAIVIPGPSFSGKTTLVAQLVRAGAEYYSDEFAVLDAEGHVHPYAKPISIRVDGLNQTDHEPAALGAKVGISPLPIGLAVITHYQPGGIWQPETMSAGDAVLAFLSSTIAAQDRPERVLPLLRRALAGVEVLSSERPEAEALVPELMSRVLRT